MADATPIKPAASKPDVTQEISFVAARLREKSTYGGLAFAVGLALPFLSRYVPGLSEPGMVSTIVTGLSDLGMGAGILIGVFLPEKGSPVGKINPFAGVILLAIVLSFGIGPKAAMAASTTVPLPTPKPAAVAAATAPMTMQQAQGNLIDVLEKFSVDDLTAALADANAQTPPDATAADCWQALLDLKKNPAINPLPAGPGVFQFIQKGRDDKALIASLQSPTGPLAPLVKACAPIVMDVRATILGLALKGGLIAATATNPGVGAGLIGLKALLGGL